VFSNSFSIVVAKTVAPVTYEGNAQVESLESYLQPGITLWLRRRAAVNANFE
jgi:hypothetical protein